MGKYRFFKIGEDVQDFKGLGEFIYDIIIETELEFYPDNFEKLLKEFRLPITNFRRAEDFIAFLRKKRIKADFMEYANVMQ